MNSNLYLIGTVHIDLFGPEKLERALNKLKPNVLAVECNESRIFNKPKKNDYVDEMRDLEEVLRKSNLQFNDYQKMTLLQINSAMQQIFGFEYLTTKKYAEQNGIAHNLIDLPVFELPYEYTDMLNQMHESFMNDSTEGKKYIQNILGLLNQGIDSYIGVFQAGVNALYSNHFELGLDYANNCSTRGHANLRRTHPPELAEKLIKVHNPDRDNYMQQRIKELHDTSKTTVAVVGASHLFVLQNYLRILNPNVMTLADF